MSTPDATLPRWDGLPREIRNQIYRSLFIADGALTPGQPISLSAQILRCNRTTYDEAHLLLWQNVFDVSEAKASQLIFDLSNPKKDRDNLASSPEHLPIILWSRKVRHVELYSQGGFIFGYYFDSPMRMLSVLPNLESFCMTIRETSGVGIVSRDRPYWTKSGPKGPYELRGLTERFISPGGGELHGGIPICQALSRHENPPRQDPSLASATQTCHGTRSLHHIRRSDTQARTHGPCITFIARRTK